MLIELVILAFALAMDAFAVAICKGLSMQKATLGKAAVVGGWFGSFQALMPALGFVLAGILNKFFGDYLEMFTGWIAFVLLAIIGGGMIKEALEKEEEGCSCCENTDASLTARVMFPMAVATSIDALAVGISLAMAGNVNIFAAIALIGVTTFALSTAGVKIGNVFGSRFEAKAQIAGGAILILLGVKILLEHLGVIG